MLRRAVFALMLIGAAFAGGAAINGPGLAWLQRNFAGGPSIIVDGGSSRHLDVIPPRQFPTAKTPALEVDLPPSPPSTESSAKDKAKKPNPPALAQAETPLLPESPAHPAADLAPLPGPTSGEEDPPVPPLPIGQPTPEIAPLPRLDPSPTAKSDPVARLASVERHEPPPAEPSPSIPGNWADLRKRMKALGVARYTLEAETDGRARFRCVIPVDGLKAIGHHFEAEGADEIQAAEAALKRITLWKATNPD